MFGIHRSLLHLCTALILCRLVMSASTGAGVSDNDIRASVDAVQKRFAPASQSRASAITTTTMKTPSTTAEPLDDTNEVALPTEKPVEKERKSPPDDHNAIRDDKMLDYYGYYSGPYLPPPLPIPQFFSPPSYYTTPYNAYSPYYQPEAEEYDDDEYDENANSIADDDSNANDGSRANTRRRPASNNRNSPIFYIRMPPTPYMFVPGMGYISQPPTIQTLGPQFPVHQPAPVNPFVNVPVNYVSNGKPTGIYQWSPPPPPPPPNYASPQFPSYLPPRPHQRPYRPKPAYTGQDSKITHLKGPYVFNGRPEDVYILPQLPYQAAYSSPYAHYPNPYQPQNPYQQAYAAPNPYGPPPPQHPHPPQYNGYSPVYSPPMPQYY